MQTPVNPVVSIPARYKYSPGSNPCPAKILFLFFFLFLLVLFQLINWIQLYMLIMIILNGTFSVIFFVRELLMGVNVLRTWVPNRAKGFLMVNRTRRNNQKTSATDAPRPTFLCYYPRSGGWLLSYKLCIGCLASAD